MINGFTFIKGEVRKLTYELTSKEYKDFDISYAEVEIIDHNKVISKLDVQIINHTVNFVVDTNNIAVGSYAIMITCHINEEVLKNKVNMEVYN